ncbi:hypothetical protein LAZ67_10001903 [Cordylochernes scorpioides]|uniref:Ribosomal protein S10 n=1 Tax=Cordylochernes scorpioides TaxID=51811 RepID=A0ABY6KWU3_9ARAC|nr:hypothetical protein LAZ67_10001903 [Cordylochernes scorpioides]
MSKIFALTRVKRLEGTAVSTYSAAYQSYPFLGTHQDGLSRWFSTATTRVRFPHWALFSEKIKKKAPMASDSCKSTTPPASANFVITIKHRHNLKEEIAYDTNLNPCDDNVRPYLNRKRISYFKRLLLLKFNRTSIQYEATVMTSKLLMRSVEGWSKPLVFNRHDPGSNPALGTSFN